MSIVNTLTDIASIIFQGVISKGAEVAVTAGRPPAPDADCLVVYVWAQRIFDDNQLDPDSCQIRSRLTVGWEAWSCYNEPEDTEDAARLYDLGEAVWCALVAAVDAGDFGECESVILEPAFVQPRQGLAVSMLGSLTVPLECGV